MRELISSKLKCSPLFSTISTERIADCNRLIPVEVSTTPRLRLVLYIDVPDMYYK